VYEVVAHTEVFLPSSVFNDLVMALQVPKAFQAESEPELAMQINGEAPGVMARSAAAVGAAFLHYSTDYVFDGGATSPYTEKMPTSPLGAYGRSKLAGEQAVAAAGGNFLIFRTAWVYSLHGHNFLKTMLRLAENRTELRVVDDQRGSPTWAGAIASGTRALIDKIGVSGRPAPDQCGVYHMTCAGETTWCGFAQAIMEEADIDTVRVSPISTAEYPTAAARPPYSVLSNDKLERTFGIVLPRWREALADCLAQQR